MKQYYLTLLLMPAMIAAKPIEKTLEKIQADNKEKYRVVDSMIGERDRKRKELFELQKAYEKSINDPVAKKENQEN